MTNNIYSISSITQYDCRLLTRQLDVFWLHCIHEFPLYSCMLYSANPRITKSSYPAKRLQAMTFCYSSYGQKVKEKQRRPDCKTLTTTLQKCKERRQTLGRVTSGVSSTDRPVWHTDKNSRFRHWMSNTQLESLSGSMGQTKPLCMHSSRNPKVTAV